MALKSFLCLIGWHDWHEHDVYSPAFRKVVHPNGASLMYRDRVCLKCGTEDRRASRLHERSAQRAARERAAEQQLREESDD